MRLTGDRKGLERMKARYATLARIRAGRLKTLFWPQGIDVFAHRNGLRNTRPLIGLCDFSKGFDSFFELSLRNTRPLIGLCDGTLLPSSSSSVCCSETLAR